MLPPDGSRKHVPLSPGAVTGFFDSAEGEHRYPLFCKKGEHWKIAVQARELGSPLDVTLAVIGSDRKELARSDDLPGTTDAGLDFIAPADGTCTLVVGDVAGMAGSRTSVYRLVVRRPVEDFALTVPAQRLGIHIGQKATLTVKAARSGGFAGPIALAVEGLPPGVRTPPNLVIPADKAELAVVLEASADAPAAAALVTVAGTARVGDRTMTHLARAPTTGNLAPRPRGERDRDADRGDDPEAALQG